MSVLYVIIHAMDAKVSLRIAQVVKLITFYTIINAIHVNMSIVKNIKKITVLAIFVKKVIIMKVLSAKNAKVIIVKNVPPKNA
jgi:hypothetical protein